MSISKKVAFLIIATLSSLTLCFSGKVEATTATDLVTEIKSNGDVIKGIPFEPDKPIFRPMYQGDYKTIFKDAVGPKGVFRGYYDPANNNNTIQYSQAVETGDSIYLKNVGSYKERKVALKVTFLYSSKTTRILGILQDGTISINQNSGRGPINYQLVYDEPDYPVVQNIYLDLPVELYVSGRNDNSNSVSKIAISPNLKKYYLTLPDAWWTATSRKYSLVGNVFALEPNFTGLTTTLSFASSVVTDNNQTSNIQLSSALAYAPKIYLLRSSQKVPYVPQYLPVRVNGQGNSTKFEANYDVGQTVSDTYVDFLPDSLKIIAEDKAGYFKKLDQKSFVFKDKDGTVISNLVTVKKVSNNQLEFSLSKASLQKLQTNQINVKLSLSDLNFDKVINNFDAEKNVYNVPLTFYNVRTKDGVDKQSEDTIVNATITPNIYGEPKATEVFVGTSTNDLDPRDLIENGVTTIPDDRLDIKFVGTTAFTTAGNYTVNIQIASQKTPALTKIISVPVTATKGAPVTSAFFENQSWLINEINRQLSPKKIDVDVYQADLIRITNIDLTAGPTYPTEHIPATISALNKLTFLRIANRQLVGSLPAELGELTKLTSLSIYGNTFDGGIPSTIGNLAELTLLSLDDNTLKGAVPASIASLPKLKQIYLNENQLSGQLPAFALDMDRIAINDNQLTYNLSTVPDFMTSAKVNAYGNTFIEGLRLTGNPRVGSKSTEIKPFNESDTGYFNLKALQGTTKQELFAEHTYTIKNAVSGEVYYTGKKDSQITIPYEKGISYTISLDDADQNPNNVFSIQGKEEEFKFEATPASLSIQASIDGKAQPAVLDGELAIFDNREYKNWKLSVTTSQLMAGSRLLKGEYNYTSKNGGSIPIVTGQKFLLETGESDSKNEIIPVSDAWNSTYGLSYIAYQSNYTGAYKGSVNWTLEDAP